MHVSGFSYSQLMHPAFIVEHAVHVSSFTNSAESQVRHLVLPLTTPSGQVSQIPALVQVAQSLSHFEHYLSISSRKNPFQQMQFEFSVSSKFSPHSMHVSGCSCLQLAQPTLSSEHSIQESPSMYSFQLQVRHRIRPLTASAGQVSHTSAFVQVAQSSSHFRHYLVSSSRQNPIQQMQPEFYVSSKFSPHSMHVSGYSYLQLTQPTLSSEHSIHESPSTYSFELQVRHLVRPLTASAGQVSHTPAFLQVAQSSSHFVHSVLVLSLK